MKIKQGVRKNMWESDLTLLPIQPGVTHYVVLTIYNPKKTLHLRPFLELKQFNFYPIVESIDISD